MPNREGGRRQAEEFIARADVIQASTDDLDLLYPERSHRETMRPAPVGPALVTVTRGPSGAMGLTRAGFAEQEAFFIEVADTVGAGDSFMAATSPRCDGWPARRLPTCHARESAPTSSRRCCAPRARRRDQLLRFGAQPPTGRRS